MRRSWATVVAALAATSAPLLSGPAALAQGLKPSASHDAARPYRINPGDQLEVYVWGEERLSRVIKVLPDGTISFPLVGQINVLGKLPHDVEEQIVAGLKPKYRDTVPQVTVSVKDAIGMQFSIIGKVRSPGAYTTGRYINVLEAVAMAGGQAEFADMSNVRILRKTASGVGNSGLTSIRVRLTDLVKGNPSDRDLAGLPQIESGDTVVVP